MALLFCLADRAGGVVSRDEIIAEVWSGLAISDDALYNAFSQLRKGLADDPRSPRYIETIPKRGYRLMAPVTADSGAGSLAVKTNGISIPGAGAALRPEGVRAASIQKLPRRAAIGAGLAVAAGGLLLWTIGRGARDNRVEALIEQSEIVLRSGRPDSDAQGAGFLEEAVAIAPDNARAWGRLALVRVYVAEYAPPDQAAAAVDAVQEAARRAMALERRQVDAHAALAILPPYFGDWLAAERRMQAVLAIDPTHLPTRDALAFLRVGVGRILENCRERVAMAAREPLHVIHQYRLVYALWFLGQHGKADRAADRALQLWPKHPGVWFARLWTLAFTGRAERAFNMVETAATRPDLPPWMVDSLLASMSALASRRPADVARAAEMVIGDLAHGPSLSINALLILSGMGEIDRAFEVAEAYLLERGPLMATVRWQAGQVSINDQRRRKTHMLFTPGAAPMRDDPRFLSLTREVGLEAYWRAAGITPDFLQ